MLEQSAEEQQNPILKAALEYASLGWHVLPLIPKGKIPASKNGLKDASTDENQLTNWFQTRPDYNLGIRTGIISGIIVVDIDKKSNGIESWNELVESLNIDVDTRTVETQGGGYHLYFKAPKDVVLRNRTNIRPGIDLRAEDGYVVAPPSHGYTLSYPGDTEIIEIPPALLTVLTEKLLSPTPSSPSVTGQTVVEGGRNHYLTQVAGKLQRSNLLTLGALQDINVRDCNPPLHVWEVETIFNSVSRYAPKESATSSHTNLLQPGPRDATGATAELILKPSDLVDEALSYLTDKDKVYGLPTGMQGLDDLLGGGKKLGEITALTAGPKVGKSALLHYLIHKWLKQGIKVGFASREMSPQIEVTPNLLSISFGENAWKKDLTETTKAKYKEEILSWPIYYTKGFGYISFDELKAWILHLKNNEGVQYFVLDHLLYAMANPEDFKEVSLFIRELKALVNREQIHLDLVIQPKNIQMGDKIGANSLRGGANLAQAVNNLLVFERVPNQQHISKLTLEIARSRLCKLGSIYLKYDPITTSFEEVEPEQEKGPILSTEDA